jgi:hypothetical protein
MLKLEFVNAAKLMIEADIANELNVFETACKLIEINRRDLCKELIRAVRGSQQQELLS